MNEGAYPPWHNCSKSNMTGIMPRMQHGNITGSWWSTLMSSSFCLQRRCDVSGLLSVFLCKFSSSLMISSRGHPLVSQAWKARSYLAPTTIEKLQVKQRNAPGRSVFGIRWRQRPLWGPAPAVHPLTGLHSCWALQACSAYGHESLTTNQMLWSD